MRLAMLLSLTFASASALADDLAKFAQLEIRAAGDQPAEDPSGERASTRNNFLDFADYSPQGFARAMAAQKALLKDLHNIDQSRLPHDMQVSYDAIKWDAERTLDREPYALLQFPYTPYEFLFRGPNRLLTDFTFANDKDADVYLKLASGYATAIASILRQLDTQEAANIRVPREVAANVRTQFAAYAQPAPESFAWPDDSRLRSLTARRREMFRKALSRIIEGDMNSALRRLSDRFGEEYQNKAPDRYGLAQYPGGKEYYKVLIRYRLTLERTPEQLYADSQAALDRIESELRQLRAEMDYFGPRAPFDRQLASDPRFTAKTPTDVERTYLEYMSRIDPFMPKLFCHSAPYGYGVQRATAEQEAALTFGYANTETKPVMRGMYYYNGSHLDQRSLLPAQALIYHELAPGHYWQAAMSWISKSLTQYPRRSNAFAESWGDFAQLLAYEQGVFKTPAEKYGRRMFNAMFHARALTDIGINYFGYDFSWGMKVLSRYTFESELQNAASLRRDTTDWQAQILPYSFGSEELLRMRERVRFALGGKFDEARFYDAVLSQGSIAFPVLDSHLTWFIDREKEGGAPGICAN